MSILSPDPLTLSAGASLLLLVDMQEKLLPAIDQGAGRCRVAGLLAQAARLLQVPVWATEHWPDKIGPTTGELLPHVDHVFAKTHFDACREEGFLAALPHGRPRIVLAGVESHICVLQTGAALARAGWQPVLVADAVGSRHDADRQLALARWQRWGLEVMSSEMVLYEWLETPAHPAFRQILSWVKAH